MAEFLVLGPVGVIDGAGGAIKLGGVKPRSILAYLAVRARRDVPVSALIDAVWGEGAPETAVNTLQVHVSSLRRALAPTGASIERTTTGYRLDVAPASVDALRFEGLIAEGRAALRGRRPERSLELISAALDLWGGRPFEGVEAAPFVESERPVLERLRGTAVIERVEGLLQLGSFDDATAAAESAVAEDPYDERAWALLMSGYYWAGRQADSLETFQRARRVLADELGLDPGPDLVALERSVLDQTLPSPVRQRPVAVDDEPAPGPVLPGLRTLVGRGRLIDEVVDAVRSTDWFVSLVGLGGIGKTSIAIAAAHRLTADGLNVRFADVSAAADATAAAAAVLRVVGREPGADPLESLAEWASSTDDVLVLDNLEQVVDAARLISALRGTSSGPRLLVTSRRAVRVRGERIVPVPPLPIEPGLEPDDGAAELFQRRAGEIRGDLARVDPAVAGEICELTAGVPLAIELAALQLRVLSPDQLLRRLRSYTTSTLDFAATDDYPDRQRSLRAVLEATTGMLGPASIATLQRCAVVAGPMSIELVELAGAARGIDVLAALADLVESGLVARVDGAEAVRVPVPVRQHVLDTSDPASRTEAEDDVVRAIRGLLEDARDEWEGPLAPRHRSRLAEDVGAIDASVTLLLERGDGVEAAELARLLTHFWLQDSRFVDALAALDRLAGMELPADVALRVRLQRGSFASYIGRRDTIELLESALADVPPSSTPDRLVVNGWCCLGATYAHRQSESELRRCSAAATAAAAASGDSDLVSLARDFAGFAASYLDEPETALELRIAAIADARRDGDRHALALLLGNAAETLLDLGRAEEADVLADEAFEVARAFDLGSATAWVLLVRGLVDLALDRPIPATGVLIEYLRLGSVHHTSPVLAADGVSALAAALAASGELELAARAWGAADAIHSDEGIDPGRRRPRAVRERWDATRELIGAARFDALALAGSTAADRIVAELIAVDDRIGEATVPSGEA